MNQGFGSCSLLLFGCAALLAAAQPAMARPEQMPAQPSARSNPVDVIQPDTETPAPESDPESTVPVMQSNPVVQPLPGEEQELAPVPIEEPVMHWPAEQATALLSVIEGIGAEGLFPADYQPDELRAALALGDQDAIDELASRSFAWLAEDLRDGRTPMTARVQWFAVDPDQDRMPTEKLMADALTSGDVVGTLAALTPTHPDYQVLKAALAATMQVRPELLIPEPPKAKPEPEGPPKLLTGAELDEMPVPESVAERRTLIRANMDRWRWLQRDLGDVYLITNVPEFQLRLVVKDKIIRTYKTVVGKPGRTATPQLAETVSAVVFNPTWTVPQSIVKGEGLGLKALNNPNWARANGYKATRGENGYISVVQQPGPKNALGLMKIDIPNEHAIYFHDTPSKQFFNHEVRAYSHGCIRTERAVELGMTMAILGAKMSPDEAAAISRSGEYTKVQMTRTFPAYITYFTLAQNIEGGLTRFKDIYERDGPVLESFRQPRQPKTTQRKSDEEIIKLDNPL